MSVLFLAKFFNYVEKQRIFRKIDNSMYIKKISSISYQWRAQDFGSGGGGTYKWPTRGGSGGRSPRTPEHFSIFRSNFLLLTGNLELFFLKIYGYFLLRFCCLFGGGRVERKRADAKNFDFSL